VADILLDDGYRVYTPTLTGLGDRSHLLTPDINLTTHVEDIVNLVLWEDLDHVVLCGHSYGGMVITGAVERLQGRVGALIYLDAIMPGAGQTVQDCHVEVQALAILELFDQLAADSNGLYMRPMSAEMFMVGESDRAWVNAKCTPHPYVTFKESLPSISAREAVARKIYVRAALFDMPMLRAHAKRLEGDPSWEVFELPYGHDLMVDAPAEVADILVSAGRFAIPGPSQTVR
jgi:pimeloyl-ACP methyl ester carboxylesterase